MGAVKKKVFEGIAVFFVFFFCVDGQSVWMLHPPIPAIWLRT